MMIGRQSLLAASTLALGLAATAAAAQQAALAPSPAADIRATYAITLAIFTIGKVDVSTHFANGAYSAEIKGSTSGLGRLVADSHAELSGSGTISGVQVLPSAFSLRTAEGNDKTRVDLTMRDGGISTIDADPKLIPAPDRVPVTQESLSHAIDPMGALVVARTSAGTIDGKEICNRTVPVFDGWARFDIALSYKEMTNVSSRTPGYSGPAVVCTARYVPVAGHRLSRDAIQYMAENKRLEAWLVPIRGTNLMIPFKFIIGTPFGDLSVTARDFVVTTPPQRQASAQ
jgi:hypothetical protein